MSFPECVNTKWHTWRPNSPNIEVQEEMCKYDLSIEIPVICIICQYEAIGSFRMYMARDIEDDITNFDSMETRN